VAGTGAQIGASAQDAARAWRSLRDAGDIQFAPLPPYTPPEPPGWLKWLGELLRRLLEPLGKLLGVSWPVMEKLLIAFAALLVLFLVWRLLQPLLSRLRLPARGVEPEWGPDRNAAVALLEEADRLAAEGRYGEAAHLLLQRSVEHIAAARPEWLLPASTAREIAAFPMLSERARRAFAEISARVERSLFALRDLDAGDWRAARAAYADFALAELAA
jgi:hypothetical protein